MVKTCIINVAIGEGYQRIQKRMEKSVLEHGFKGDVLLWQDWANDMFPKDCIYNIKAGALFEAILRGYRRILWLDASIYAVNDVNPILDIISKDGYYFWKNGNNAAQECNDKCLDYYGIIRDKAEDIPMLGSGMFGIDLDTRIGQNIAVCFMQAAIDGIFIGKRGANKIESKDPRFLHHRQDQSALSLIANQFSCKLHNNEHISYEPNSTHIFGIQGI